MVQSSASSAPRGYHPIPGSRKGGYRKPSGRAGRKWDYRYPDRKARKPPVGKLRGHEVKLTQQQLLGVLARGHFSILSAGKAPWEPGDGTEERYHRRTAALRADLSKRGLYFTEVLGHYGAPEDSFIVWHTAEEQPLNLPSSFLVHHRKTDDSEHAAIRDLAARYGQESVIHSKAGYHELHYVGGQQTGQFVGGQGHTLLPFATDNYTEARHPGGSATRFSLNFDWGQTALLEEAVLKSDPLALLMAERDLDFRDSRLDLQAQQAQARHLAKGGYGYPTGTVHHWSTGPHKKQADGSWKPVKPKKKKKRSPRRKAPEAAIGLFSAAEITTLKRAGFFRQIGDGDPAMGYYGDKPGAPGDAHFTVEKQADGSFIVNQSLVAIDDHTSPPRHKTVTVATLREAIALVRRLGGNPNVADDPAMEAGGGRPRSWQGFDADHQPDDPARSDYPGKKRGDRPRSRQGFGPDDQPDDPARSQKSAGPLDFFKSDIHCICAAEGLID